MRWVVATTINTTTTLSPPTGAAVTTLPPLSPFASGREQ